MTQYQVIDALTSKSVKSFHTFTDADRWIQRHESLGEIARYYIKCL